MSALTRSTSPSAASSSYTEYSAPNIILNNCHGVTIYTTPGDGPRAPPRLSMSGRDVEEFHIHIHIATPGQAHTSTQRREHPHIYSDPCNELDSGRPVTPPLPHRDYPSRQRERGVQFHVLPLAFDSIRAQFTRPRVLRPGTRYHPPPPTPARFAHERREQPHYTSTASTTSSASAPGLGLDGTAAVSDIDTDEDDRALRQAKAEQHHITRSRRYEEASGAAVVVQQPRDVARDSGYLTEGARARYAARVTKLEEQATQDDLRRSRPRAQVLLTERPSGRMRPAVEEALADGDRVEGGQSRNFGSSEETLVERASVEGGQGEEVQAVLVNGATH